ncbi:MAG TPA: 16S rRNA (cytosine(967)-C(5))-methyltransferase RsmB, partial [Gammaproteobacteria bacterium]|nr:16S rRNA (cytosine(967)-C(5))-methyltransferase RsmB [Gammaproteobacteria bacterium]
VEGGQSLPGALAVELPALSDRRMRALAQELSYGTLRWYYRLDSLLAQLLPKPLKSREVDLRCLLLAGLYQMDSMALPQRVAVNETVQATRALNKRWASGMVNAVLRNFQRHGDELEAAIASTEQSRYAHPAWFIDRLRADWPGEWEAVLKANNTRPPFSLRVNRSRMSREAYLEMLAGEGLAAVPLEHTSHGIVLERAVQVEDLPGFSEGLVTVQDGAAQLAAGLLQLDAGQRVLDACAAPGGKTSHILETVTQLSDVTALDIDAGRQERTTATLKRLSFQAGVVLGDAAEPESWWDGSRYDRILLDAPCSATGVIRRHPDIKLLRKLNDMVSLVDRQSDILRALWPLLVPGGILLYCTCSVLAEENSRQVKRFLQTHADAAEMPLGAVWGHRCEYGTQILPGENEMDGFYFACLCKTC